MSQARKNTFLALALGAFAVALACATLAYNVFHKPYAQPQQESLDVSL